MTAPVKRRGAPPKRGAAATVIQPVRLSPEEQARYQDAARALGTTLSDEARRAWERMARRAARA